MSLFAPVRSLIRQIETLSAPFFVAVCLFTLSQAPLSAQGYAQTSGDPKAIFEQSLILYRNGDYDQARTLLNNLVNRSMHHPHLSKTYLLLSAVHEKLGDLTQAQHFARQLLKNFPSSQYAEAALFALARCYYAEGKNIEAISYLLSIIDRRPGSRLGEVAMVSGSKIVSDGLYDKGLESLLAERTTGLGKNILLFWLARQSYGIGQPADGSLWLQKMQPTAMIPKLQLMMQELKTRPATSLRYPVRIGLILPLSGVETENGMDFLRGLALAVDEQPQQVEIFLMDSGSQIKQSIRMMQRLLRMDVSLVIGELAGDRTSALAAMASERNLLYLAPVASDNGISELGPRVFQMSSDLETRGIALASYAYHKLGLRSFACLAPADEYGQALCDAFTATVDRLGGTMVAQQWYYPGAQDLSRQFAAIRESALHFSPRDTLTAAMDQDARAQASGINQPDYNYSRTVHSTAVQDRELSIRSIDGFFMPVYAEDLSFAAPQYALANIQAVPLGGDDWLHNDLLRNQRRYLNGAIFCTSSFATATRVEYIHFRNRFRTQTAASPGTLALPGYDIMRLLLQAIRAGNRSGLEITSYLTQLKKYTGLGGNYSFAGHQRINADVVLLQFKDGVIMPLEP